MAYLPPSYLLIPTSTGLRALDHGKTTSRSFAPLSMRVSCSTTSSAFHIPQKRYKRGKSARDQRSLSISHSRTMSSLAYVSMSLPRLHASSLSQSFSQKKACDWSRDAFDQTQHLLELNPEFYTVWNYRRNIVLHGIFPRKSVAIAHSARSHIISISQYPRRQ